MLALLRGSAWSWLTGALAVLVLMAAVGAILLTLLPADDVRAGPGTVVRVSPASQTVSAGANVDIEIRIDNVTNLGTYEFRLMYDPSVVEFVPPVVNGPFLGSTGRSVTCQGPQLTANTILYGCNTIGGTIDGPTGSGLLATVRLSSSCSGSSALQLATVNVQQVLARNEEVITFETQDGSVTVTGGGACPTPTLTPTATLTAALTHTPTPTNTPGLTATPTPAATATPSGPPTATPTASPTAPPGSTWTPVPTWTPAPTWTPVPTWTSQPLPTITPIVYSGLLVGDADCSGAVDPVDATVILQWWVGLAAVLHCPADANGDRTLSIVDATVILQFYAGMVASLPP